MFPAPSRRAVLLAGAAATALAASGSLPALAADESKLDAYFERKWQLFLARSPERQTSLGMRDPASYGRWDDISESFEEGTHRLRLAALDELRRDFDPKTLAERDRLNHRLYEYVLLRDIEGWRWRHHFYPIEHFNGRHGDLPTFLINFHAVKSPADFEAWLSRVRGIGGAIDQLIESSEASAKAGIIAPRFSVAKCLLESRGVILGAPFEEGQKDSQLFSNIKGKIAALKLPEAEAARMTAEAATALKENFGPAYGKLVTYLEGLEKRATDEDGVWKLPDGDAFYRYCLKRHTTLALDPDAIHAKGLEQVARIHRDMRAIMTQVGFKGDLQAFFQFLRTDDRFYYPDTPEGHEAYLAEARRVLDEIDAKMDTQFITKHKAKVIVQRFQPYEEPNQAIARYSQPSADGSRPGIYYTNFMNMREMPKYQLEVLAFHEAIPGHHTQIAIAQEQTGLPKFRRFGSHTAYVEGWGLYSERLPKEMGFYKDPYSDFGRLTFELWRAIRLVVDTGIHAKKWTKERAIDYFTANSSFPRESAAREVERYVVYPGQACAYMIGMLKLLELRDRAKTQLGARFDIREYHDTVLRHGAVPLPVLEELVDSWIGARKAA
ncbi:MAG TPA: DUF885 domain-containing protein [Azospirillaceae bacterium]|nr:DUF885 domain-containing protein [Azospirillaceae bacterium]